MQWDPLNHRISIHGFPSPWSENVKNTKRKILRLSKGEVTSTGHERELKTLLCIAFAIKTVFAIIGVFQHLVLEVIPRVLGGIENKAGK